MIFVLMSEVVCPRVFDWLGSWDFYVSVCVCVCVGLPHHGRGGLLYAAKDKSLAIIPDLVLPITQPVH